MKREIKNATAIYTGGNIYIYYGQLLDGNWFRTCDDWEGIEICDSDTSVEEADYYEFYEEHTFESLEGDEYKTFWNEMLLWIIHNAPEGNYQVDDLERRMINDEIYLLKISYSWGDEEPDQEFTSFKEAWERAKEMAIDESEIASEEHECEIGLSFDKEEGNIRLHYTYDDEYCFYNVMKE